MAYISYYMEDNKIRIVKPHKADSKPKSSLEFAIPRELTRRYELNNETYLMLIPDTDSFTIRKLVIPESDILLEKEEEAAPRMANNQEQAQSDTPGDESKCNKVW
jgi:hypothetical protein